MRWDQADKAAAIAALGVFLLAAAPLLADGKVTAAEWVMLGSSFCLIFGSYIKDHPPKAAP